MKIRFLLTSLVGAMLLQGCGNSAITGIPDAQPFAPSVIDKPRSMQHWKMIAQETVNYITEAVPFNSENGLKLGVFIVKPEKPTEFERAYFSLLASQFTAKGVPVLTERRAGALVLNYTTQVVEYEGREGYQPFQASAAATAAGALYAASPITVAGGVAAVIVGETALAASEAHKATNRESLLNVSLQKDDWLMLSWSKVLSIHANDAVAYKEYKRVKLQ